MAGGARDLLLQLRVLALQGGKVALLDLGSVPIFPMLSVDVSLVHTNFSISSPPVEAGTSSPSASRRSASSSSAFFHLFSASALSFSRRLFSFSSSSILATCFR